MWPIYLCAVLVCGSHYFPGKQGAILLLLNHHENTDNRLNRLMCLARDHFDNLNGSVPVFSGSIKELSELASHFLPTKGLQ